MKILITGGAGFIGGNLAERFIHDGHNVIVLDTLDPFYDVGIKEQNIKIASEAASSSAGEYKFVEGSITDPEVVDELVDRVDYIYHQAAQAGVRASVDDPEKTTRINVEGTFILLEAARANDIKRFVNASSSSVYGKPVYLPYDEEHPTNPVSPYGASKLAAEHYVRVYNEIYDLPTVSLRYFTVYGPRMRPNMAFTNFVSRCLHGESPVIFGDGSKTRDFTYIDDIIEANRRLLSTDSADGEVLNIGSTDRITIKELAQVIRDEIDPSLKLEYDEPREGDTEHTHADVSKAVQLLEYEPSVSIEDGARQFVEWYRNNEEWYDPLVRSS